MVKTFIKETIIILLLCLAIILLMGILLYEYVPTAKTIPNSAQYTTPENVKQELAESTEIDESQIILTYEVDSNDLNNYKRTQDYKPGKANPFSSYEVTEENTGSENGQPTGNTTTSGGSSTTTGNTTNTETSGGTFFKDKGTK